MSRQYFPTDALRGRRALLVSSLIFAFPATTLVVPNAASLILLLLALTGIVLGWREPSREPLTRDEKLLVFSVVFFCATALLAYLAGEIDYLGWKKLGRYMRFLFFVPIYFAVRRMAGGGEGAWWAGVASGATAAGLWGIYAVITDQTGLYESGVGGVTDPILFGDISLAMAFMSLGGFWYFRERAPALAWLPFVGFGLGCVACVLSGVRGAWIAIPALLAVLFFMIARGIRLWQKGALVVALLLVFTAAYFVPETGVRERLDNFVRALLGIQTPGEGSGPVLIRLELWRVAFAAWLSEPMLGVGPGGFLRAVQTAVTEGRLEHFYLAFNHPHNEYLSALAERGLIGFVALLLVFGVPFKHFLWAARHRDTSLRQLGYAGIVLIVAFLHFALTEAVFDRAAAVTFYAFVLAVVYGLVRARERVYLTTPVPRRKTLSAIIIAKNEADRIRGCLDSIKGWVDEIVVLDSGSTDGTVEICRAYTDKIWVTDWPGFGIQKQRALEKATCEWVLALDADEVVSPELKCEIDKELQDEPTHAGYRLPRPLFIFGSQVDFGGSWQAPLRLFRRDLGRYTDLPVHEKVVLRSGRVKRLRAPLYHETYRDYGHALDKFTRYAKLQAQDRYAKGVRCGVFEALGRACFNFFRNYILFFGFLDGGRGLLLAMFNAQYTYNKYANVWALALQDAVTYTAGTVDRDSRGKTP
ncbi:MAG TPA: O-antigen ligase family protein [Gammaproteobacteria bacterium]|nr:O-antigen ligase family protein [Gammaproteobacteria bacterium]